MSRNIAVVFISLLFVSLVVGGFTDFQCSSQSRPIESDGKLNTQLNQLRIQYNSTGLMGYIANLCDVCAYGSAGYAQVLGEEPLFDAEGRQNFGSLTKSMTSTLMAILLAKNKIINQLKGEKGWETTLGMIFGAETAGNYEQVTLAALSSMFGGLPSNPDSPKGYWSFYSPDVSLRDQRTNITMYALKMTPTSKWPHTKYLYSDLSYVILGHIIERSLDMSWEDALIKHVLEPLEIIDSKTLDSQSWPFGSMNVKNWGHIYVNESTPMLPCNPHSPPTFITEEYPYFQCDNAPNIGPSGTYSGNIITSSKYFQWVLQCSAGMPTQDKVPLTKEQCQQIQTPYGPMDEANTSFYGFGWIYSNLITKSSNVTYMAYEGSNLMNIAGVWLYPAPYNLIVWASTNGGGINTPNEQAMIVASSSYLSSAAAKGEIKCPVPSTSTSTNTNRDNKQVSLSTEKSVALIGDSLFAVPVDENDLIGKLMSNLKDYSLRISSFARSSTKIQDIADTLPMVLKTNPDAVVLFWDTDVSNVDENVMTEEEVEAVREAYKQTLSGVIQSVLDTNAYMLVLGPELLGEGPIDLPPQFSNKTQMLDDYVLINQAVCESFGVDYLNIRQVFLDAIPPHWKYYKGSVTQDGEHENERGTRLVAEYVSSALKNNWLSPPPQPSLSTNIR